MNMFQMFEPTSSILTSQLKLNWFVFLFTALLLHQTKNKKMKFNVLKTILMALWSEKKELAMSFKMKSNLLLSLVFVTILGTNTLSILPYNFCNSSHMSLTMGLALNTWLALMLWVVANSFTNMIIHLTPLSAPLILSPFLVVVETISLLIRPLTLSLRLTANMIAGHIILNLAMSAMVAKSIGPLTIMMIAISPLTTLELGVALIQSYVFVTLISLYISEN
uniref:ATP synthase subunit a n=1 Tax=Arctotanais alascensis TaxID=1003057 RepID=A0A810VQ80_9CRUS|nr:ATP synthase F0 subunit 6 [Arctotanais alascensis]